MKDAARGYARGFGAYGASAGKIKPGNQRLAVLDHTRGLADANDAVQRKRSNAAQARPGRPSQPTTPPVMASAQTIIAPEGKSVAADPASPTA